MITKLNTFIKEDFSNEKLNNTIINPNFSIVVPGGCNGKCSFCFWKQGKMCENYINNLTETLNSMPSQFDQLSLTGGEPTLSPYLDKILENIDRNKWKHTVLTTNGTNLMKYIPKLKGIIEHVNISRHHYNDEINQKIFGTDTIPNSKKLKILVNELNKNGIDVTYSAVLTEHLDNKEEIEKYIEFANSHGVKQVFFRKQHGTLDPSEAEKSFESIESNTHNCPVCRNTTQYINNTKVVWKASLEEPSKELGMIYEVVYNQDGQLTSDWEQEFKLNPKLIKENKSDNYDGLWDYTLEEAAKEIWEVRKGRLLKRISFAKQSGRVYRFSSNLITREGCKELTFEPNEEDFLKISILVQREIDKYIKFHLINLNHNVIYDRINDTITESNVNYSKIISFDKFDYSNFDNILEGCGDSSYSGCGSSDGDTSYSGCGGGSYSGCGGGSYSGCGGGSYSGYGGGSYSEEETEDERRERIRQQLLKNRKKKINKIRRNLKNRPENE